MTPMIWAVLAISVIVLIGVGTFIAVLRARDKARNAGDERTVATPCAANGHSYRIFETGWRCITCGNYVPRIDGEVYGPEKDGLRERRRESR